MDDAIATSVTIRQTASAGRPLVVDLDGRLLHTDTSLECNTAGMSRRSCSATKRACRNFRPRPLRHEAVRAARTDQPGELWYVAAARDRPAVAQAWERGQRNPVIAARRSTGSRKLRSDGWGARRALSRPRRGTAWARRSS